MSGKSQRSSPLALMVLSLLAEAPMHAYRMQQLIKERGKDSVVNVAQRNSVYQTVDRLLRAGLIEVCDTEREPGRPERTVYRITPQGSDTVFEWLRSSLSTPAQEYPAFPVAISVMMLLTPADVAVQLRARIKGIGEQLVALENPPAGLPRLFLMEDEYRIVMLLAELDWVRSVLEDLESGTLGWSEEWLRQWASGP